MKILQSREGKAPLERGQEMARRSPRRYRERSACQPDTNSGGTADICNIFALSPKGSGRIFCSEPIKQYDEKEQLP